jgi:predicted alpha/beta superfamily hydrolase
MKNKLLIVLLIITSNCYSQFSLRLVVVDVATKKNEDIYVCGTFNNWNPKDENYKLKPFAGGRKAIVIKNIEAGNYALKFTRGSFANVECEADGRDIADRVFEIAADRVENISIKGWKDEYPQKPKPYTALPQVKIIDTSFFMPQLNKKRRVWLCLPKSYATSSNTYPVLYLQDGQNLFNEQTANAGEWTVDEIVDSLQKKGAKECIIVGIDNGLDARLSEYSPYDFEVNNKQIVAQGKQYASFLANTLKPYIDAKYRTKKQAAYNFVAGSSLGGLISWFTVISYPQVFSGAGVFSPSFWISKNCFVDAQNFETETPTRFYLYAGGKESNTMVSDMDKMTSILQTKQNSRVIKNLNPMAQHNEAGWKQEFASFYLWILKD